MRDTWHDDDTDTYLDCGCKGDGKYREICPTHEEKAILRMTEAGLSDLAEESPEAVDHWAWMLAIEDGTNGQTWRDDMKDGRAYAESLLNSWAGREVF